MTDIVERLLAMMCTVENWPSTGDKHSLELDAVAWGLDTAADEITALRAEVEALRGALDAVKGNMFNVIIGLQSGDTKADAHLALQLATKRIDAAITAGASHVSATDGSRSGDQPVEAELAKVVAFVREEAAYAATFHSVIPGFLTGIADAIANRGHRSQDNG